MESYIVTGHMIVLAEMDLVQPVNGCLSPFFRQKGAIQKRHVE